MSLEEILTELVRKVRKIDANVLAVNAALQREKAIATAKAQIKQREREGVEKLEMNKAELQSYEWAINQSFQSVAARYARTLARYILRTALAEPEEE